MTTIFDTCPCSGATLVRRRHTLRVFLLVLFALLLRLCTVLWFSSMIPTGLSGVMAGHDGAEYIAYADAIAQFDLSSVPEASRRHNPGWPLIIGAAKVLVPPIPTWAIAWGVMLVAFAMALGCYHKMLVPLGLDDSARLRAVCALGFACPSLLYFQSFALVDSVLLLFVLACVCAWQRGRYILAALLLACATAVRMPVIFLGCGLFFADLLCNRTIISIREYLRRFALLCLALLLPCAFMLWCKQLWGSSAIEIHHPQFGLPLSGLLGFSEVSPIRALYVFLVIGFFIVSTIIYMRRAVLRHTRTPFDVFVAAYAGSFLLFHLSLKSMHYGGNDIHLFNYQDRYYNALLPFCILPWLRFLSWRVLVCLGCVAALLSCYWGKNYFRTLIALTS